MRTEYKGFSLVVSGSRGGKAGRSRAKTGTVQVREPAGNGYFWLMKQIRFSIGDTQSLDKAVAKAKKYVDELKAKAPTT